MTSDLCRDWLREALVFASEPFLVLSLLCCHPDNARVHLLGWNFIKVYEMNILVIEMDNKKKKNSLGETFQTHAGQPIQKLTIFVIVCAKQQLLLVETGTYFRTDNMNCQFCRQKFDGFSFTYAWVEP